MKPTFQMIAERAGVGRATAERVLNGRGGVRPEKVMKVVAAARALDWPGRLPELHRGILRIEILLVRPDTAFYTRLTRSFQRIGATLDRSVQLVITHLDESDPVAIARAITEASLPRAGLVVAAPDAGPVRDALKAAVAAGLPVVQVVERVAAEADFVGIENYAVGRTAGLMLSRMCVASGPVLGICHSGNYEGHRARMRGFSDYLSSVPASRHHLIFTAFGQDSRQLNPRRLNEALREWPDLVAVYNAGGANTELFDILSRQKRHVFFVGHELTDTSAAALRAGVADVVFDQLPEAQARRAVNILLARLGLIDDGIENPPIRFTTVTSENI
ncbi:MAG: LacI family DNA-binding transcriptional regulator [Albidovulum sp.]